MGKNKWREVGEEKNGGRPFLGKWEKRKNRENGDGMGKKWGPTQREEMVGPPWEMEGKK